MKNGSQSKNGKMPEFEEDFSPGSVIKIIIISIICMIVGTMVLGGVVGGLAGVIGSWALLIFGWFYIIPITVFVTSVWAIQNKNWTRSNKLKMTLCAGVAGGLLMILIGLQDSGNSWTWGYFAGGFASGIFGSISVFLLKHEET